MGGMDVKGQVQGLGLVGRTPFGQLGERLVPFRLLEGPPTAKSGASLLQQALHLHPKATS